jgi:hypothetical protein
MHCHALTWAKVGACAGACACNQMSRRVERRAEVNGKQLVCLWLCFATLISEWCLPVMMAAFPALTCLWLRSAILCMQCFADECCL